MPEVKSNPSTGAKKPDIPQKNDAPKAPVSVTPKTAEPKATPVVGEKKPDEKPKATEPKAVPTAGEKRPDEKPKATDSKAVPIADEKKPEDKPLTVTGAGKTEIPLEPRPIGEPKDATAADPKGKNEAVEPPKGVRITQVFEDRLESPSQKDLESLPIPGEGEGFSMRLHPAYFFEFLDHPFYVNRETDDYRELFDSIKENGINEPIKARPP